MAKAPITPASAPTIEEAQLLTSMIFASAPSVSSRRTADDIASPIKTRSAAPSPLMVPSPPIPSPKPQHVAASDLRQQFVDHTYADYAMVAEQDLRCVDDGGAALSGDGRAMAIAAVRNMDCSYGPMKRKGQGGSATLPFPGKLLEVLDRGDLTAIIDWRPHGRAFLVTQQKVFAAQVLPRFFKQTKFLSFTRQLNLWGFKRLTRGLDAGAYYHPLFLPGRPHLVMRMKRLKIKGTGVRPVPNPDEEPDLYDGYPHLARVARKGPIPLPPLPSERMAGVIAAGGGGGMAPRHPMPAPPASGPRRAAPPPPRHLQAGAGLGQDAALNLLLRELCPASFNAPMAASAAAAAELRLWGLLNNRHPPASSLPSLPGNTDQQATAFHDPASALYAEQIRARMMAPPAAAPPPSRPHPDEAASADRPFLDRLLAEALARQYLPVSAVPPQPRVPQGARPVYRNEFFQVGLPVSRADTTRPTSHHPMAPPAAATDAPCPLPYGALPSRKRTIQDVEDASIIADALGQAQRLEDMAQIQREAARALVGKMHQRHRDVGGDGPFKTR